MADAAATGKNTSRIASLMGTWTTFTDLKATWGNYQVQAYFVVHFMPNPLLQYGCEMIPSCLERDNRICQRIVGKVNHDSVPTKQCEAMETTVSDWSDVSAFYYIGFHVHAGIPFRVEKIMDTGDWIGPFNLVLAQEDLSQKKKKNNGQQQQQQRQLENNNKSPQKKTLVDSYSIRYVETATSSKFLTQKPVNNSLLIDFDNVMGLGALNTTRQRQVQSTLKHGDKPYERYLKSCENAGNLRPILPLYGFDFYQPKETTTTTTTGDGVVTSKNDTSPDDNDGDDQEEDIELWVDYQLLVAPQTHNTAYKWMPWIQARINRERKRLGFGLDGPYCYGNDPQRAYTISISMDSSAETLAQSALQIQRGCVEGLPCLPRAAQESGGNHGTTVHPRCPAVIDVTKLLYQVGFWLLLGAWVIALLVQWRRRCRHRRRRAALAEEPEYVIPPEESLVDPIAVGELVVADEDNGDDNIVANPASAAADLTQPLLSSSSNGTQEEVPENEQGTNNISGGDNDSTVDPPNAV